MKTFRTADTYVPGQKTLDAKYYNSDAIFELEQEKIFKGWMCVGHVSRIEKPGDYFVANIFNESLIIVRSKKNQILAYHNVCRHRGTRICEEKSDEDGHVGHRFICPYHAWTYNVEDGSLETPRFMEGVPGFDTRDYPLQSAPVYVWEGLIFISLSDNPTPFEKEFAPLIGKFRKWNIEKLKPSVKHKRISYTVPANWKLVFLNFNECYHCPGV